MQLFLTGISYWDGIEKPKQTIDWLIVVQYYAHLWPEQNSATNKGSFHTSRLSALVWPARLDQRQLYDTT
jgi:hypothetical protein